MNALETLGLLVITLLAHAYPQALVRPKQDMTRYGAVKMPSWLNPTGPLG